LNFILFKEKMSGKKIKILLVEDKTLTYLDVKKVLEEEGYLVLNHPEKVIIDNYADAVLVVEKDIPHIAVIDIEIKGDRDGIEIGQHIRSRFFSPVIFLSGKNTPENLRRTDLMGAEGFVVKHGKPYELEQLKTDISRLKSLAMLADKRRTEGAFFHIKQVNNEKSNDFGFRKIRILWHELQFVRTIAGSKNNVCFTLSNKKEYMYHKSMNDTIKELPPYLLRFSGREIINSNYFNGRGKGEWVYYIDNDRFEVSPEYRTDATRAQLNKLYL